MYSISEYKVMKVINENEYSRFKKVQNADNQMMLLLSSKDITLPHLHEMLNQGYEFAKEMKSEFILKPLYKHTSKDGTLEIFFENFDGILFKEFIQQYENDYISLIKLSIQLCKVLETIHGNHVTHKQYNPLNMLIDPLTKQMKALNLCLATKKISEKIQQMNIQFLSEGIAYISPEQTGRMNRTVDYRTDIYSLGVTLYEMFTKRLPFESNDHLEYIHSHIAKKPTSPIQVNAQIPIQLSNIIMKCLEKSVEERYQSVYGLRRDLEKSLKFLEQHNIMQLFELGVYDSIEILQIPQKLYGRESETNQLIDIYNRTSNGNSEMVLISGYSGIGKTALVREVQKYNNHRGFFISGKFDQYKRDIPYYAFIQAFQELVKQILTESQTTILVWKEKIERAVQSNGQVLVDVIPEIETIIGEQSPVQELSAEAALDRFNEVFKSFMNVFLNEHEPLCLFLDDLQWADLASLDLLKHVLRDRNHQYLFIIGAYRDNEVTSAHPLNLFVNDIKKDKPITQIQIKSLLLSDIINLVSETLNTPEGEITNFAKLLDRKTQGNPFFLNQFIKTIYEEGMLKFDIEERKWNWDLTKIEAMDSSDNVVEFMVKTIKKLSSDSQQTLSFAACIGNTFDLNTLTIVLNVSKTKVSEMLWEAIEVGLIIPKEDTYPIYQTENDRQPTSYSFLHDRVQQAAYSLIAKEEKKSIHLQIGQLLLNSENFSLEDHIFDIINHFNLSEEINHDQIERSKIANLNLRAGKKAKVSTAYESARRYLKNGLKFLPSDCWEKDYELTYAISRELSECEYLCGNFEESEMIMARILNHSSESLDRAKVYNLMVNLYYNIGDYQKAMEVGLKGLKELKIDISSKTNKLVVMKQMLKVKLLLRKKSTDDLIDLPENEDPYIRASLLLLKFVGKPAYIVNKELFAIIVLKQIELSVRFGNTDVSSYSYAVYGLLLRTVLGDVTKAAEMLKVSFELVDLKYNHPANKCSNNVIYGGYINPFVDEVRKSYSYLLEGYKNSIESGDLITASHCLAYYMATAVVSGERLEVLQNIIEQYYPFLSQAKDEEMKFVYDLTGVFVTALSKEASSKEEVFDIEQINRIYSSDVRMFSFLVVLLYKYLNQEYKVGLEVAELAISRIEGITLPVPDVFVFHALFYIKNFEEDRKDNQTKCLEIVRLSRKKILKFTKDAPQNFLYKMYLLEAEIERLNNDENKTIQLYRQSIKLANQWENHHFEAIATERLASYYEEKEIVEVADVYHKQVLDVYDKWGVTQLAKVYSKTRQLDNTKQITKSIEQSSLDLKAVIQTSQTILGEIVLEKLLDKIMDSLMQISGAERGYLLFENEENWIIEAEKEVNKKSETLQSKVAEQHEIPLSIIQYVARAKKMVVLQNALTDQIFSKDVAIIKGKIKSVLCIPISYKGNLNSILYLENNLTEKAFTEDRIEILNLLSSQCAISIENAYLYEKLQRSKDEIKEWNVVLEQRVVERTIELQNALDELQATQQQLVESEKMASLGNLVAGIAHEVNTPLGIGVTAASHLQEKTNKFSELFQAKKVKRSDLEAYLENVIESNRMIQSNLKRSSELINSFKQVAVDQSSEQKRKCNFKQYIEDILLSLRPQLKNVNQQVVIDCDVELEVIIHPGAISQIFTNLIMNSITHAYSKEQEGTITISVEREEDTINIRYSDDGKGMPEDVLSQIFEPFFTTNRSKGGSGLGMHIVYNLVHQVLKGTIISESEVGKGTSFVVSFKEGR